MCSCGVLGDRAFGPGGELSLYSFAQLTPDGWREELRLGLCMDVPCVETGATFGSEGLEMASLGFGMEGDYLRFEAEASFSPAGFIEATVEAGLALGDLGELGVALSFDSGGFAGAQISFGLGLSVEGMGEVGTSGVLLDFDEGGAVTGQVVSFGVSFPPWEAGSAAYFDAGSFLSLELGFRFSGEAAEIEAGCGLDPRGISSLNGAAALALDILSVSTEASWASDGSWRGRGEATMEPVTVWGEVYRTGERILWGLGFGLSLETVEVGARIEALEDGFAYSGSLSLYGDTWTLELSGSLDPLGYWEFLVSVDATLILGGGD